MTESNETNARPEPTVRPDAGLAPRLDRMRTLRSAFAALAPSALTDQGRALSQAGRALTQRLAARAEAGTATPAAELARLDADLDAFERAMRELALALPVAQLRSTLPGRIGRDRRSVLDLLDLLLIDGDASDEDRAARIGPLDYLITLLCTAGARSSGRVVHDPATLTPRLAARAAEADEYDDPRIDAAEAEFYTAATMSRDELREEFQRRTLRQRKVELGPLFFSSRILRAVVTYNAALLERVTDEILDAGDWGRLDGEAAAAADAEPEVVSVFASARLRRLAAAARRRVRGEPDADSPEQRIVAAFDLDALTDSEREALAQETVGSQTDPIGTAILVGLLCRSLAVLSIELQELGLAPDLVSDVWVGELATVFEALIEEKRDHEAYRQAYALAELRNKLLLEPVAERLREEHGTSPVQTSETSAPAPASAASAFEGVLAPARPLPPPAVDSRTRGVSGPSAAQPGATLRPPDDATARDPARPTPGSGLVSATASVPAAPAAASTSARSSTKGTSATSPESTSIATARSTAASIAAARTAATPPRRSRARDLVREALEDDRRGREESVRRTLTGHRSFARLAQAALVVLILATAFVVHRSRPGNDLRDFSREQLGIVSPHLVDGRRNGDGHGPGFVGTLDASWDTLDGDEREAAAEALVARLRERGLDQVMIYDRARVLRIQAIGAQPIRTL